MKYITTGEEIFDNKQRLSVKLEYDKNGREVLRKFGNGTAEGYLYGSDGKRTATVDNKGSVTLISKMVAINKILYLMET